MRILNHDLLRAEMSLKGKSDVYGDYFEYEVVFTHHKSKHTERFIIVAPDDEAAVITLRKMFYRKVAQARKDG